MELNIADTIRNLRKKMGITQEELANEIGVTAQAVSKWERGEGYPDITLLPDIAEYFHVTLDILCGIDEQKKREQISSIIDATANAPYAEGVKIAREGLAKFPHAVQLRTNLARALMGCTATWTPPREVLEEVIGLYESINYHSAYPNDLSPNDVFLLCQAYVSVGEHKKARQLALQMNGKYESQRIWCRILKGEELVSHIQNSLIQTLPDIHFMVKDILKTNCYTTEEKITVCKKMIEVYALFDESRDWPIGLIFSYQLYTLIAILSMKLQDTNGSLMALDKAAELAVRTDLLPCEGTPTSLLINRIDYRDLSGTTSERAILRQEIEAESAFAPLGQMPEFEQILAKLS
ncbi:MAG: helix-turn-helix transcriptional regulator [Clostridia bacterium]|nr:helix-turn-helix transcriptional regulator [Clostridia bacterium]